MIRRLTGAQLAVDIVGALVFLLFGWAIQAAGHGWATGAVLLAMTAGLVVRRLAPGIALALAWAGAILQMSFQVAAPSFLDLAVLGILYCTASYGGRLVRWIGLGSAVLGSILATGYLIIVPLVRLSQTPAPLDAVRVIAFPAFGLFAVLGLSWTLGLLTRTYRNARDSRRAQSVAERGVVVEQERNRIARDMHDVVAHSLAVVIAQADGARYAAAKDPLAVDAALTTISATAREALGDVRLLLTQLRHSQGDGPQPALADLDRMVEQFRDSGLDVRRSDRGSPGVLASGQQLALYRIVQESLTNALRHGDSSQPVMIVFDWAEPVSVVVSNALGDSPPNPGGHGVIGMRERAALVAGTLNAGVVGDRWVVAGSVPA